MSLKLEQYQDSNAMMADLLSQFEKDESVFDKDIAALPKAAQETLARNRGGDLPTQATQPMTTTRAEPVAAKPAESVAPQANPDVDGLKSQLAEQASQMKAIQEALAQVLQKAQPTPVAQVPVPSTPVTEVAPDLTNDPLKALQAAGVSLERLKMHLALEEAKASGQAAPFEIQSTLATQALQAQIDSLRKELLAKQQAEIAAMQKAAEEAQIESKYRAFIASETAANKFSTLARVAKNDPDFVAQAMKAHLASGADPETAAQTLEAIWSKFLKAAAVEAPSSNASPSQPEVPKTEAPTATKPPAPLTSWYARVRQQAPLGDEPQTSEALLKAALAEFNL